MKSTCKNWSDLFFEIGHLRFGFCTRNEKNANTRGDSKEERKKERWEDKPELSLRSRKEELSTFVGF